MQKTKIIKARVTMSFSSARLYWFFATIIDGLSGNSKLDNLGPLVTS